MSDLGPDTQVGKSDVGLGPSSQVGTVISRCPGGNLKIAAAHPVGVSGSCGLSTKTVPGPTRIKLF